MRFTRPFQAIVLLVVCILLVAVSYRCPAEALFSLEDCEQFDPPKDLPGQCKGCPDADFGEAVGWFNDVCAYSNCRNHCESQTDHYDYYGDRWLCTGMKWQCVEYVNRFWLANYGQDVYGSKMYGDANGYFGKAASAGYFPFQNGGPVPPEVGDILCSNGGGYGHVAIVREVYIPSIGSGGYVVVIHQNFLNSTADDSRSIDMDVQGGRYTVESFNKDGEYPVAGWVRRHGIRIISPRAGDVLYKGAKYSIRWDSRLVDGRVQVHVYVDGVHRYTLGATEENEGELPFVPPYEWPTTNQYEIRISNLAGSISGRSGKFTIMGEVANSLWHPNGTLVKTVDRSTVCLIDNNRLRPFVNEAAFFSHRYGFDQVVTVSDDELRAT